MNENINLLDKTYSALPMPEKGSTVVLGLSGGVDSTLACMLLQEAGCKVIAVTMSLWNNDLDLPPNSEGLRNSCYGPDEQIDIEACKTFCAEKNIEYHVIPVKEAYKKHVMDYFKSEYRHGRTPNPCIMCNPKVKFGALLEGVEALGIKYDYFCTGHYARLVRPDFDISELYGEANAEQAKYQQYNKNPVVIGKALDVVKDQGYFLYRIPSSVLEKVRFPLGNFTKQQVFEMARERGLKAAEKAESQDFVPPEFFDVIFSDVPPVPGNIVDLSGKVLGKHKGIEYYTIGQRRGLGVSANVPLYVHSIDSEKNCVVLCENDDLLKTGLIADNWVWAGNFAPTKEFRAEVKIRLASKPVMSTIIPIFDDIETSKNQNEAENQAENQILPTKYKIIFDLPQRAVAPGQSAVLYLNGTILGGGLISQGINE